MKPTRSQKSTETCRSSGGGLAALDGDLSGTGDAAGVSGGCTVSTAPHSSQNFASAEAAAPQVAQTRARALPHSRQICRPACSRSHKLSSAMPHLLWSSKASTLLADAHLAGGHERPGHFAIVCGHRPFTRDVFGDFCVEPNPHLGL